MPGIILTDTPVEAAVRVREPECSQMIRCNWMGISVRLWLPEMQTNEVLETAAQAGHRPKARRSKFGLEDHSTFSRNSVDTRLSSNRLIGISHRD